MYKPVDIVEYFGTLKDIGHTDLEALNIIATQTHVYKWRIKEVLEEDKVIHE